MWVAANVLGDTLHNFNCIIAADLAVRDIRILGQDGYSTRRSVLKVASTEHNTGPRKAALSEYACCGRLMVGNYKGEVIC
jgi:hypothetical protein